LRRPVRKDILSVGIPKLLSGAASFLIRIYMVRFLAPAGYGALSFGLDCLLLFDALAGSALDLGTIGLISGGKPCDHRQIQPAEKAAVQLKLMLGAVLVVFCGAAGEWLGHAFLHGPGGRAFFVVLAAGGTSVLLLRSVQLHFQASLRFRVFGAIDLAHSCLRVLCVGFVLYRGTPSALSVLACFAVAPAVLIAAAAVYAKWIAGWSAVRAGWTEGRGVLKSSGPILASFGVSSAVSRLDVFLLALRSNPAQLGLYGAALTIATIPEILGAYLAPVFLPRILPAYRNGTFARLFRRVHWRVYSVAGALLALGLLAGRPALAFLLPARYSPSIGLAGILIPGTLAAASFFPLTLNFLMLTRPRTFLVIDSLAAPFLLLSYLLFLPVYGAVAAAWITCLHRLVKAAIVQTTAYALAHGPAECASGLRAPEAQ
jgi:O-antigen/teichoic acid export membrane protein